MNAVGGRAVELTAEGATLALHDGRDEYDVRFTVDGARFGEAADTLLALLLLPATRLRRPVRIDGEVSPRILGAVPAIQAHYESWGRRFRAVDVLADARTPAATPAAAGACLFSGGVDSFYTLLRHQDSITHLIFVHGFDIDLADARRRNFAVSTAREVADRMGKQLVEVETNLRSFSDVHVDWILYFGAAMAAVALLLQPSFGRVFFASGFARSDWAENPPPAGSHFALDPLWSTEASEIVHADADVTRIEKIRYIAQEPLAMDHLLVCYEGSGEPYNCGRCSKCLRTMASLRLMGALERCRTLPDELDLDALAAMKDRSGSQPHFIRQNLRLAREHDPELASALAASLEGSDLRSRLKAGRDRARALVADTRWAARYRVRG
jgi:hypothetical protein